MLKKKSAEQDRKEHARHVTLYNSAIIYTLTLTLTTIILQ